MNFCVRTRFGTKRSSVVIGALYILNISCSPGPRGSGPSGVDALASRAGTASISAAAAAGGPTDVLTNRYNNSRTGANLTEYQLHTGNVNADQFGKLFTRPVVGQIYAQPLIVSNFTLPDATVKNLAIVATMRNNVYAFDAEDPAAATPIWQASMGTSFPFTDYGSSTDITDNVGVLATPVIDRATNTLYIVATTKENNQFLYKLHALDLGTGKEMANSPVIITGTATGTTPDAVNGVITFDPKMHLQRPGLLLTQGKIVIAFASHFDARPYHGWIFSYDAQTLTQSAVTLAASDSEGAGIWQSGTGLSSDDAGNIFAVTGNGFAADATKPFERTESVVKWSLSGLQQVDWFTPANWQQLDAVDDDLGVDGPMLIPGTNLVITGAKSGALFVMDRGNMGRLQANDAGIHQEFQGVYNNGSRHIHGSPVFWQGPQGNQIYVWGENDFMRAFTLRSDGYFATQANRQSTMRAELNSMPGGIIAISANGSAAGTGIVWANLVLNGDALTSVRPGILRAFDASDITHELWNSEQNAGRDRLGAFAKFNPPTVANGKVYMATFSNELVVYGLLPGAPATNPQIAVVQPAPVAPPQGAVNVISSAGSICLSSTGGSSAFQLVTCGNAPIQSFQFNLSGEIRAVDQACANAFGGLGNNGDTVGAWPCSNANNEKWNLLASGEIRGINGRCLTADSATAGGSVSIQDCTGAKSQQWTTVPFGSITSNPPPPPPPPGTWVFCASEDQFCDFSGPMTVRYGSGNTWVSKDISGGTPCTNSVFGDPLFGVRKQCQVLQTQPSGSWTLCANEDQRCDFSGTMQVRYGAGNVWVTKTITGGTACTNAVFGDPLYGTRKQCQIMPTQEPPPTTWTACAQEDGFCAFTGTKSVRYGSGSVWVIKTLSDGTACTNAVFGDPLYGTRKQCEVSQ